MQCHYFLPVLPNNILSPKYISSVPHSLSPWVNQFPHTHSAETETHIHFCPKSPKPFDLPGFFRQQSDCLNMITIVQTTSYIFLFLIRPLFQHFYRVQIVFFYITNGSGFIFLIFICCLINSLLMRDTPISLQ